MYEKCINLILFFYVLSLRNFFLKFRLDFQFYIIIIVQRIVVKNDTFLSRLSVVEVYFPFINLEGTRYVPWLIQSFLGHWRKNGEIRIHFSSLSFLLSLGVLLLESAFRNNQDEENLNVFTYLSLMNHLLIYQWLNQHNSVLPN